MASRFPICPEHRTTMVRTSDRFVCNVEECDVVCWLGPTSTPGDRETRALRSRAHMTFDPLWKYGTTTRDERYKQLAEFMGLHPDNCHIGMFDANQCRRVLEFADRVFRKEKMMSLLDKVQPSRQMRPPRILLLGTEKVGKSTFASSMQAPVFLPIAKEEGIDDIDTMAFPVAKEYQHVLSAIGALHEEHEFKTFVIDSASTLNPIITDQAMKNEGVESESKLGGGFGHQYDEPLKMWSTIMAGLDSLRMHGVASVLIGHVAAKRFDDPVNGAYTRYDLDLPQKITQAIYRWVDVILFANWETYTVKEDVGFNKEASRGIGSGTRKLFTQRRPSHPGGGRGVYGRLPYEMPFRYDAFMAAVKEQLAAEKQAKQPAEPADKAKEAETVTA